MKKVLLSYCIEKSFEPEVVATVLQFLTKLHERLNLKATLFVTGRVLESNREDFLKIKDSPYFEFASHSFNHIGLKSNFENRGDGITFIEEENLDTIGKDLIQFNKLYFDIFGKNCVGFCSPRGFNLGFSDRVDLLEIVKKSGYKYLVSWTRNKQDWFPVPCNLQPFFYEKQGYSEILEIPCHGWQDAGWHKVERNTINTKFWEFQKKEISSLKDNMVFGFSLHDWVIFDCFLNNEKIEDFYQWLKENKIQTTTFEKYCTEREKNYVY